MNKQRFYIIVIFGLLLSNLILIGFNGFQKKDRRPPHPDDNPKNIVISKLGFDNAQIIAYEALIKGHQNNISERDRTIHELKNQLYDELKNEVINTRVDSLTAEIANYQKQIEQLHFKHFQDIKKICKPEQIDNFNRLVNDISTIFSRKDQKKPKDHKRI